MPFHTAAFNVDIGTTADTQVTAITDDVLNVQNSNLFPMDPWQVIYAAAMSATLNRAKIVTPTLRQFSPPYIRPIIAAATPPADPKIANYSDFPLQLNGNEQIEIQATSDIAMGTESCTVVIGLQKARTPAPSGTIFTMRGTSTTASVADTWTTLAMTWEDNLPEGRYAAVGLNVIGATQVAARLRFEDQIERPGALATAAVGNASNPLFRKGRLGMWGSFRATHMPDVQVLNTAAVSVHTAYLDFVRTG